ncbi:AAA family ATPase [Microcystis aeruginosa CS-563/04]|uniref:ATP-dependent nuclease n=1 Tax=Microcystis aeruginosa TaxID=1126 RepID=UPI00232E24DF|nr:AAA family ATPase [Microcystis aeruginosa]MDB9422970.1 AAA family ATPase [Microcystis aeruginosa CS-563/04]
MITKLTLRNFKSIKEQTYEFFPFDLLVGRNNSGKSTILQALAIWQFCIEEFRRAKRGGKTGKQVVLPNFTALPVPEFNLLWREKTERHYPTKADGSKKQEFILIEIDVTWIAESSGPEPRSLGVRLRYSSPQTIYAIPSEGWEHFRELEGESNHSPSLLPIIAYVPPFSGLEPNEEWRDDGPLRKQVGKAQPGSILRNLLLRVWQENREDWSEIQNVVKNWFNVDLKEPQYERGVDTQIICEYKQGGKSYDIISAGSGFHQTLTLLAFFYGYKPTTILLDEPDAHLHVNLQREILDYFKNQKAIERNTQFLIATHAEEFIRGVDVRQIISLLDIIPKRVEATPAILTAMADVSNLEITQLSEFNYPVILYVEGETDERLLRGFATSLGKQDNLNKVCFRVMGGGNKKKMKEDSDRHFNGIKQIIPSAKRLVLFDYDDDDQAFHPEANDPKQSLYEWRRKNIENYLLVPDAWMRAALQTGGFNDPDIFFPPVEELIRNFFDNENLTLPRNQSWRDVKANIFQVVDGKKLLFENRDSLFQRLKSHQLPLESVPSLELTREIVATNMKFDEIHEDVHQFFAKLDQLLKLSKIVK